MLDFNPRPLTGATCYEPGGCGKGKNFNPRPLTGATAGPGKSHAIRNISIHAPSRGRRKTDMIESKPIIFQSTPPHGGDNDSVQRLFDAEISIHAPSRGRPIKKSFPARLHNFNPRPLTGATVAQGLQVFRADDFNPRPLTGATPFALVVVPFNLISIHAPSRGRLTDMTDCYIVSPFQSTPPHGGDPVCRQLWVGGFDFNPRPLTGATSAAAITNPGMIL